MRMTCYLLGVLFFVVLALSFGQPGDLAPQACSPNSSFARSSGAHRRPEGSLETTAWIPLIRGFGLCRERNMRL